MNWQPIETAPQDGTMVDLWTADGYRQTSCWFEDGVWLDLEDGMQCMVDQPTHWMPIPPPPTSPPSSR